MELIAWNSIILMIFALKRNINTKAIQNELPFEMIRFREFFAVLSFRNFLSFSSSKNNAHLSYHTLFEMMWALYNLSYMIRKMTVFSIVSRGHQIPSPCKGLACHHFKKKISLSYRNGRHPIIPKRESVHHIERTAHPSFRRDSAQSFQNDSFAYHKSGINQP